MNSGTCLAAALLLTATTTAVASLRPAEPQEMAKPTEHHAYLHKGVGHWEGTLSWPMPDGTEMSTPARETVSSLGGFWTTGSFEGEAMGMPFQGRSTYGYDPAKGKFVGSWVDSMSDYMSVMEGDYDKESNVLEMRWRAPDHLGNADVPHRSELRMEDKEYRLTFYAGEPEALSMEIKMQRVDKPAMEAGHSK